MEADQNDARTDFTQGPVFISILHMGLPSMFGFLSQNIYALVDTFWVSRLPAAEAAVAAITFVSSLQWLAFSFNNLVGPGSVAVISRRYGEKAYDEVEKAIRETIVLKLFFGGVFGLLAMAFIAPMLELLGARDDALLLGTEYGQIMFAGMAVPYATYSIFTAMRGVANPKMAMTLMIVSNLLNIALDPILIFGYFGFPALGIRGAAIASLTSLTLTFLAGIVFFTAGLTNVPIKLRGGLPMAMSSMKRIVTIGIPSWLGGLSYSGARLVITPLVATFGTQVVAAYGVGNQITAFGLAILVGIGLGLAALIGHTVGAGKFERARRTADHAIRLGVAVMLALSVIVVLFGRQIMGLFFEDPATLDVGVTMLNILALGFPFMGAFLMIEEIHAGVGMNMPSMVFNLLHAWLFQIVPLLVLTMWIQTTEIGIWWTISVSTALSASLFYAYFRRGRWLAARV